MPKSIKKVDSYPTFLIADNSQEMPDKIFVVHTESPKCLVETELEDFNTELNFHWIFGEPEPKDKKQIEILEEKVLQFIEKELDSQEDQYSKMFNSDEE